jgi:penicillin-insensitive murein endopeptidase
MAEAVFATRTHQDTRAKTRERLWNVPRSPDVARCRKEVMAGRAHGVVILATACALALGGMTRIAHGRTCARHAAAAPASPDWDMPPVTADTRATPFGLPPASRKPIAAWGAQQTPAPGPARVYGRTTSGCIAGAVALPDRGDGFVRQRPGARTGFGHPDLIAYVGRLGEAARAAGLGALRIGDLSLPRGGVYLHNHSSHQTGLDVDISFWGLAQSRAAGPPRALPASAASPTWAGRRIESLLRLAAADERVDRIFVGARIKERLCRTAAGDRSFLDVLRPWLGHEDHFHVRLKCPADSPGCHPNQPISSIPDDCEALSRWWKTANVPVAFARWQASERAAYARDLPPACQVLPEPAVVTTRSRRPGSGPLRPLPQELTVARQVSPPSARR